MVKEGKIFGLLTVVGKTTKRINNGCIVWKCVCKCGQVVEATSYQLQHGLIKGCGKKHLMMDMQPSAAIDDDEEMPCVVKWLLNKGYNTRCIKIVCGKSDSYIGRIRRNECFKEMRPQMPTKEDMLNKVRIIDALLDTSNLYLIPLEQVMNHIAVLLMLGIDKEVIQAQYYDNIGYKTIGIVKTNAKLKCYDFECGTLGISGSDIKVILPPKNCE